MPVPRPVTSPRGRPVKRRDQAGRRRRVADAHVAGEQASWPPPTSSSATSMPTRSPASASSRVMAGPTRGRPCPRVPSGPHASSSAGRPSRPRCRRRPRCRPDSRASTLTAAPPARKFSTMAAVTSCGHGVTPWATHAVVAGEDRDHRLLGYGGGERRWMPGQRRPRPPRGRPRAPAGLVRLACRARAPPIAAASSGRIESMVVVAASAESSQRPLCRSGPPRANGRSATTLRTRFGP